MSDAPKRMLEELERGPLRDALEAGARELPSEASLASLATKLGLGAAVAAGAGAAGAAAAGASSGAGAAAGAGTTATAGGTALAGVKIISVVKIVAALAVATGGAAGAYEVYEATRETKATSSPVGLVQTAPAQVASAPPAPERLPLPDDAPPAPSATPSAKPTASAISTASDPVEEAKLLGRAQEAIGSDPARALALATDHASKYPRGALAQEREVLAVDALLRLGRRKDAEARARAFRATYPTSGHVRRLDALLAKP